MPIDLAQGRVFAFEVGGRKFTMTTKPITKPMWLKYFGGITSTQEVIGGDTQSSYESAGARLELLESALVDATGYTPEGESITSIEGWQAKLPMAHRRAVADLLTAVDRVTGDQLGADAFPLLGSEVVILKSTWTMGENGKMQEVTGLRHFFRSPTADHQKRYSRASSRSVVVGGSRTGKTIWLGYQDVLMEIYDELIDRVEGYTLGGEELQASSVVALTMDSYHKVAAASALFTPLEIAA